MNLFSFSAFSMMRGLRGKASILKPLLTTGPLMRGAGSFRSVSSRAPSLIDQNKNKVEISHNGEDKYDEFGDRKLTPEQTKCIEAEDDQLDFWRMENEPIVNIDDIKGNIPSYTAFNLNDMKKTKVIRFLNGMKALFPHIKFFKTGKYEKIFGAFILSGDRVKEMPICSEVIKSIINLSLYYKISYIIADTSDFDEVNGEISDTYVHFAEDYFGIKLNSETNRFIYMKNLSNKREVIRRKGSFAYLHSILHELAHVYRRLNKLELSDDNEEENATISLTRQMWIEVMMRELGQPYTETTMSHYCLGVCDD